VRRLIFPIHLGLPFDSGNEPDQNMSKNYRILSDAHLREIDKPQRLITSGNPLICILL